MNDRTNKVRLCDRNEPQSEPFVEQSRSVLYESLYKSLDYSHSLLWAGLVIDRPDRPVAVEKQVRRRNAVLTADN